ncbi:hypothetical protein [Pseudomonas sp. TMW22091]|uniref:hypothetical protein n=1 Tax=Pseudomonas sp. TMW22091 TaxID=2506435 RepID=UPI001F0FC47A|nr:hypothetical protein [Pseudomonas sp. TMW22091]MCH4873943.1 hypothetical protein [Pseudomonas sp. TMW22091]
MNKTRLKGGMHNLLLWITLLLFIACTNALIYASSLLNFRESSQLIFVFSFYLFAYLGALFLLIQLWNFAHKFLAPKPLPGQKIVVTYEVTLEEYEKIKTFLADIRI